MCVLNGNLGEYCQLPWDMVKRDLQWGRHCKDNDTRCPETKPFLHCKYSYARDPPADKRRGWVAWGTCGCTVYPPFS